MVYAFIRLILYFFYSSTILILLSILVTLHVPSTDRVLCRYTPHMHVRRVRCLTSMSLMLIGLTHMSKNRNVHVFERSIGYMMAKPHSGIVR